MKLYFENYSELDKYIVEPHKLDIDLYDIVFIDTHDHGGERAYSKRFESEQDAWNFIKRNAKYNNWLV